MIPTAERLIKVMESRHQGLIAMLDLLASCGTHNRGAGTITIPNNKWTRPAWKWLSENLALMTIEKTKDMIIYRDARVRAHVNKTASEAVS